MRRNPLTKMLQDVSAVMLTMQNPTRSPLLYQANSARSAAPRIYADHCAAEEYSLTQFLLRCHQRSAWNEALHSDTALLSGV